MSSKFYELRHLMVAVILAIYWIAQPVAAQKAGERATGLRSDIALDEARLQDMQANLDSRIQIFEEFSIKSAELGEQAKRVAARIEAVEAGEEELEAAELSELQLELVRLNDRIAQEQRKAALAFDAIKISRSEIRLLEQKLVREERALKILTGEEQPEAPEVFEPPGDAPSTEEPLKQQALVPLPGLGPSKTPESILGAAGKVSLAETPEQIQTRKTAEKAAAAALQAEQQLREFVERKQALIEQIELENSEVALGTEALEVIKDELTAIEKEIAMKLSAGQSAADISRQQERAAELQRSEAEILVELESQNKRVAELTERLEAFEVNQNSIAAEVEIARAAAEQASEASIWARSAANPVNILRWLRIRGQGILVVALSMIVIVLVTRFAARRLISFLVKSTQPAGRPARGLRAETVSASMSSVVTGIVTVIALMVVLREAGVNIATVLGGAAIFGVAVAFGAQNLMKDYFNGFMILLEDQYGLDDLVTIGTVEGRIERVTMRVTVVRDIEGRLHFIPNGQITLVTNRSYEWSRAMFDIPVPYSCDVDKAMEILMDEANEFCEDMNFTSAVADKPEMLGVNEFAESSIMIRFFIKTAPSMHLPVKREMLRRIKKRFDKEGISIPFPHRVIVKSN